MAAKQFFFKGLKASYKQESHGQGIYLCTDTNTLYVAGVEVKANLEDIAQIQSTLESLQTEVQGIKESKGQANGIATLDEGGKVPASQLNGALAKVFGIEKAVANQEVLPTEGIAEGDRYYTIDTKKIYERLIGSWDEGTTPKEDTIYNFRKSDAKGSEARTNILYRWDGEDLVEISSSLAIGTTPGTAYDGGKGHQLEKDFNEYKSSNDAAVAAKVDKVAGSSLVEDTEITKLKGLSDQDTIDTAIADAKQAGTTAEEHLATVSGHSGGTYTPNGMSNYITGAISLNDADVKLDAQIKENANAIEALKGDGEGSVSKQISAAITTLKGDAAEGFDTLGEIEDVIQAETSARESADQAINGSLGTKTSGTIEATTVWGAIEEVEGDVTAIDNAYQAADTVLQGNINSEAARAQAAEQANTEAINAMDAAYKAADTDIRNEVQNLFAWVNVN